MAKGIAHPRPTHGDEGALAAVLPASARFIAGGGADARALSTDPSAADADRRPDVLLGDGLPPGSPPNAPVVVMSITSAPGLLDGGSRAADALLRFAAFARAGSRSATAARRLRDQRFPTVRVIRWDHRQPFPMPGHPLPKVPPWHPHRYPRRALVLASRAHPQPTVLDAALEAAGAPEPQTILAGEAALVVVADSNVVKVAVGAGCSQVLRPVQICQALRAASPDPVLADRMPWVEAHGTVGLGAWSAERRLPGRRAEPPLSGRVLDDCRAILAELFRLGTTTGRPDRTYTDLEWLATAVPPESAAAAARLAANADHVLADVPRGFGHGDFWYENLLVDANQLTGVLDWDSAGPGRLPLLDLLHLLLSARRPVPGYRWGPALLQELKPWAENGADDLGRRYCRELGLHPRPGILRALVVAYWLDWVHYQFDRYADRRTRARWVANNVIRVAHTLDAAGWAHR